MLAVFLRSGNATVQQTETPGRPRGSALIRMRMAGICNTDLELQRGYYGFDGIPGHEFVGTVVEADTLALVGKRVVGEINLSCGQCRYCINTMVRHCENRTVLGIVKHPGAFAEYLTLPEKNLHVVPDSLPDEEAVFVEPLAAARHILDHVRVMTGLPVAVLGDGKLGLLIAQVLVDAGARPVVYGRHEHKLAIAKKAGARVVPGDFILDKQFDLVVDSTGSADGLRKAVEMTRPCGTLVMKSTIHEPVTMDMAPVIVNEIVLVGSRCGRFEPALKLLNERKVDVRSLISAEFPLAKAPEAFTEAAKRGVLKVLLRND